MTEPAVSLLGWLGSRPASGASVALAALAYAATVTVGTLSIRGRRIPRRRHTGLFIATVALTALAAALSLPQHPVRAALLALALVPLGLLPALTAPVARRPRRHVLLGLAAAPAYLAALALWAARPT